MNGTEIDLEEMLAFRENRVSLQQKMIKDWQMPVISFSMNIPGPIKTNKQIRRAFSLGRQELFDKLGQSHLKTGYAVEIHENCGDELLVSVRGSAEEIKDITVQIEESSPLGRLYDMDVINTDGTKLSRPVYRKCLICEKQAQECARSRTHTVAELQGAVDKLLRDYLPIPQSKQGDEK